MLQVGLVSYQQSNFGDAILRGAVMRFACELRIELAEEATEPQLSKAASKLQCVRVSEGG